MSTPQDLLVDVPTLAAELERPEPPILLDVRWRLVGQPGHVDYAEGHLPGAVFLDLDRQLCGQPGDGGRHPLPEPGQLQRHLRAAGVRAGRPVVVYDGGDGAAAARAWWTLRWAGHAAVRVLDGGYPAWVAAGRRVTAEPTAPVPGDVTVRPGGLPVLDAPDAAALARAGGLVDARAAARYRGETEPVDRVAGHIPGAVNLPSGVHLDETGRWRPPGAQRAAFAAAGVPADGPVGAYCGSGVTAAQTVFALHLAGRPDAALYVGSWSHWITAPHRPVATAATGTAA